MIDYLDFKEVRCKNCYKCLKECPVKAIRIENHQARIIKDRCILCGRCTLVCPQNAKIVASDMDKIKNLLKEKKVIASVAPSFISNFNIKTFSAMNNALKKLGFVMAEETARGARVVSAKYHELIKEGNYKNLISSCCPSTVKLIEMYYPEALKYLAPVDSPIIAHAKLLKKEYPDHCVVFIGPCISKKRECDESGLVDAVMSFEELDELFKENNIELIDSDDNDNHYNLGRFYPISRGIIKSFEELDNSYVYIAVDGVERCKEVLQEIDELENVFLEINTCRSSCIGGPCSINRKSSSVIGNAKVRNYVHDHKTIKVKDDDLNMDLNSTYEKINLKDKEFSEDDIQRILNMTGKFKKEDELNCGACGYESCRQKAWAVLNGFADINMCLPYMREKAESLSNEIMKNTPNGILVLDNEYRIVEINDKGKEFLNIDSINLGNDSIYQYVSEVDNILEHIENKTNAIGQKTHVGDRYLEYSITYISEQNIFLLVIKDITDKTNYERQLEQITLDTLSVTDEVINKQMRVVQEVASLLGEATAETKIALINLKNTLKDDADE